MLPEVELVSFLLVNIENLLNKQLLKVFKHTSVSVVIQQLFCSIQVEDSVRYLMLIADLIIVVLYY